LRNEQLLQLSQLSADVYRPLSSASRLEVFASRDFLDEETSTHCRGYVTETDVIIAIEGTKELIDWLNNGKIRKEQFHGVAIHRGYVKACEAVINEIAGFVTSISDKQIIITGHSRGGGIGVPVALALQTYLRTVYDMRGITLVTFGQPKVATKRSINSAFHGEYVRVQNGSDAVPRRPNIPFYYSHAGELVFLPNSHPGEAITNPTRSYRAKDRLFTVGQRVSDHFADNYVEALEIVVAMDRYRGSAP
jgi:hypothetical protein